MSGFVCQVPEQFPWPYRWGPCTAQERAIGGEGGSGHPSSEATTPAYGDLGTLKAHHG